MKQPGHVQACGLGGLGAALGAAALAAAGAAPSGARLFFPREPVVWGTMGICSHGDGGAPPSSLRTSASSTGSTCQSGGASPRVTALRRLLAGGSPAGAASCAASTTSATLAAFDSSTSAHPPHANAASASSSSGPRPWWWSASPCRRADALVDHAKSPPRHDGGHPACIFPVDRARKLDFQAGKRTEVWFFIVRRVAPRQPSHLTTNPFVPCTHLRPGRAVLVSKPSFHGQLQECKSSLAHTRRPRTRPRFANARPR